MNHLVITADDFGLSEEVNEAIEVAHCTGLLRAAGLMVAGPAASDAVRRARRLPELRIGLHIVLVEGRPALPPTQISDLVDGGGHLRADMFRSGVDIIRRANFRRQIAAEITAQFDLFRATCLPLDHVSGHKHFHIHPTVAASAHRTGNGFLERHDALGANFEDPRAASGADYARCRVRPPLVWGDDGPEKTAYLRGLCAAMDE